MSVAVIGTVYVDIKGFPLGDFVPTGRNVGDVKQFHGGVARNIAEDTMALGENTIFVGLTDKSGIGLDVVRKLRERGVNTDYVRASDNGMGTWLAVFDENGEVCANVSKRPDLRPICDILAKNGKDIFKQIDSLLLEIDIDEEIVKAAFELAEEFSIPVYAVISNMTIARERIEYIKKAECFICNRQEAGIFFEKDVKDFSTEEMLSLLKEKISEMDLVSMVITMDANGSVFASRKGDEGICPAKKVEVIDTTGAGDAFFAGVSVGLTRGRSLQEACFLGTEAAAKVICTNENVC